MVRFLETNEGICAFVDHRHSAMELHIATIDKEGNVKRTEECEEKSLITSEEWEQYLPIIQEYAKSHKVSDNAECKEKLYYSGYFGEEEVFLSVNRYEFYNNLAISLLCKDEDGCVEPYGSLTVNIKPLLERQAALDTNNLSTARQFVEKYKLGKFTGNYVVSGYCTYPVYEFDIERLNVLSAYGEV